MTQNFARSGLIVALVLMVASVIGAGSYALCQGQNGPPRGSKFDVALGGIKTCFIGILGFSVAIAVSFLLTERPLWLLFLGLLIPGGWLHHRLSGNTNGLLEATWIIFSSCLLSVVGGAGVAIVVMILTDGQFGLTLWDSPNDIQTVYFCALYGYPLLAPIAAWVWRSFKPKRGVEVYADSEEFLR